MADDDVIVQVEGDLGDLLEPGKAPADPVKELKSQFDELQKKAERDETARIAAEARARDADATAARAIREAQDAKVSADEDTITSGL